MVRCIQYKKVSQFAKEVHITFSSPTFCSRFVNSTSLAVNEKSYFILSAQRPVTFVGVFDVIYQKRVRVFHQGFQTSRNMKARGRRPSAFIVSRCLEPLMKHEARVFEMASQTSVKISWNFFRRISHQKV